MMMQAREARNWQFGPFIYNNMVCIFRRTGVPAQVAGLRDCTERWMCACSVTVSMVRPTQHQGHGMKRVNDVHNYAK